MSDFTADTLLSVRRRPTDRRIGKVRLGDIWKLHWRRQCGGTKSRFMAHPFVFGLMKCTDIAEGRVAHTCQHGPPPHDILVCICKKDNPKALIEFILAVADRENKIGSAMYHSGAAHWLDVAPAVLRAAPAPTVNRPVIRHRSKRWKRRQKAAKARRAKKAASMAMTLQKT